MGDLILGHEGKSLMHLHRGITLVGSLLADLSDHPLDWLGRDLQVGQFSQIARRLLIGNTIDAGMDDLLLHAWAEAGMVNAQRLILRENTPADSGGTGQRGVSRRPLPAWS